MASSFTRDMEYWVQKYKKVIFNSSKTNGASQQKSCDAPFSFFAEPFDSLCN